MITTRLQQSTSLIFVLALAAALALPATAEAQQRPPTASDTARIRQEAQQRLGRSVSQAELIERLRQSGMTRAQVRQRLAQAGYNPALADAYFDVLERGGEPGRGAADSTFVQALVRIGVAVPGVVVPLPDSALSVQDSTLREEAATGELQVFGRSVFRRGTEFNALALGPVDPDYRIGPGDELFLWLTGDVELAYTLDVSREGTIVIPDVGQVPVSGLTLGMLQDRLYDRLGRVYSGVRRGAGATTQFQVSIGRLRASQVYVIGDVLDPGAKQVSSVGTALNALHVAGGPTDRGSFRRIEVRRGGRVIGIVDLYDYLVNGDASSDVRLEHGDRVFVPPVGAQVRVQGSVRRPAIYEMRPGEGLRDVLTFAGGLEPDAIVRRVQIDRVLPPAERTPGRYRVVRDIELEQLFAPNTTLPLQDGDVVHVLAVPDEVRERVWIVGAVNNPGLFEWSDGLTLGQLITRADGLADPAYRSRLQIYRRDPATGERSMVSAEAPATGDIGPPLADGDSVVVLSRSQLANPAFVAVDGFVKEPGDYSYMEGMTVRDLILAAGGFVPGANTTEVELSRLTDPLSRTDTTAYVQRVSLGLDSAGAGYRGAGEWPPGAGDIVLSRGDRVFVRRAPGYQPMAEVVVTGEVAAPGTYILQTRQDRVTDVLHRAGWLTDQAHRDGVRVSRGGTIVAANLERALANESDRANIRLEPGDSIHVAAYDPTVTIAGAVTFSARALHREGRGLDYYLDQAGGTVENADRDRITVTYPNGERARVRNVLWMERSPDIKPGSVIFVPFKPEGETGVDIDQLLSRTLTIITTAVTLLVAVNQLK